MYFKAIVFSLFAFAASAQTVEQTQVFARKVQNFLAAIEPTYERVQALKTVRIMYMEAASGQRDREQTRIAAQDILDDADGLASEIDRALDAVDFAPVGHPEYDRLLQALSENSTTFADMAKADYKSTQSLLKAVTDRDREGFVKAFNSYERTALDGENMAILISEASLAIGDQTGPQYWLTQARLIQLRVSRDTIRLGTLPRSSPEKAKANIEEIWASGAENMSKALDTFEAALLRFEGTPIAPSFRDYQFNGVPITELKARIETIFRRSMAIERAIIVEMKLISEFLGRVQRAPSSQPLLAKTAELDRKMLSLLGQRTKLTKMMEPVLRAFAQAEL